MTFLRLAHAEHCLLLGQFEYLREQAPGISVEVRAPDRDRSPIGLERSKTDLRSTWLLKLPLPTGLPPDTVHMVLYASSHP
jgi:hypothetical protein